MQYSQTMHQAFRELACKCNDVATEGLLNDDAVSSSILALLTHSSSNNRSHSNSSTSGIFELTDGPKAQSCQQESSGIKEAQERVTSNDQA